MDQETKSIHFVFVLDESGSMSDDGKFDNLKIALINFIESRKELSADEISIVMFNSGSRVICSKEKIADYKLKIDIKGGGTDFYPGVERGITLLK